MPRKAKAERPQGDTAALNASLPKGLREWVDRRVAAGGFGSVSEYIRVLIRADRERLTRSERFEEQLLRSMGPGVSSERRKAVARFKDALEMLRTAHELMEQNLRRDHPEAPEREVEENLAAWSLGPDWSEETRGYLERSPSRLRKLLRGKG